jgi:hypothetical protein
MEQELSKSNKIQLLEEMIEIKKYVTYKDYEILCEFLEKLKENPYQSQRLYFMGSLEIKIILLLSKIIPKLGIPFSSVMYPAFNNDYNKYDTPYYELGYLNEFKNIKLYHNLAYSVKNNQYKIVLTQNNNTY